MFLLIPSCIDLIKLNRLDSYLAQVYRMSGLFLGESWRNICSFCWNKDMKWKDGKKIHAAVCLTVCIPLRSDINSSLFFFHVTLCQSAMLFPLYLFPHSTPHLSDPAFQTCTERPAHAAPRPHPVLFSFFVSLGLCAKMSSSLQL